MAKAERQAAGRVLGPLVLLRDAKGGFGQKSTDFGVRELRRSWNLGLNLRISEEGKKAKWDPQTMALWHVTGVGGLLS